MESLDSRTTLGGLATHSKTVIHPFEMLIPGVIARIEQSHERPSPRILGTDSILLVIVSCGAGEPEILLGRWTSQGSRKEVIHLHELPRDCLLTQTVTATIPGILGDSFTNGKRNVGRTHGDVKSSATS